MGDKTKQTPTKSEEKEQRKLARVPSVGDKPSKYASQSQYGKSSTFKESKGSGNPFGLSKQIDNKKNVDEAYFNVADAPE